MRALVALGGNAMTGPGGEADPESQQKAVGAAMEQVAALVERGVDVVLTHGNGPQVGNLLLQAEMSASRLPPMPLDWCGAATQGYLGMTVLNSLAGALSARGRSRPLVAITTRVRIDPDDPGLVDPTKPVGPYAPSPPADAEAKGQIWTEQSGGRGWRRVVASPEPLEVLEAPAILALIAQGFLVVAGGGGGVPVVPDGRGGFAGVEAVIDKDLTGALLATLVDIDVLCIATDVPSVLVDYGTAQERPLGRVTAAELRRLAADGHFAAGSMGPKVEAALRFVEHGGRHAVITSLDHIDEAVDGTYGTVVTA